MKAKVIVDNIADNGIPGEWGLSIYIEHGDVRILLDTGASDLFAENAEKMGINLSGVDYGVLSHAHYDHAGGMSKFFALNPAASFYLRDKSMCYDKKFLFYKYSGGMKATLKNYADRIVYAEGDYHLAEGVYLIPHHTEGLEEIGRREKMYVKDNFGFKPDSFSHEQSLVLDTSKGLVIFNSCSHGGAANIINEVAGVFPGRKVYGIIGGFHLYNKSETEVRELAKKIRETGIEYVCTGHCTGKKAYAILKEELGGMLHQLHVGLEMKF